MSTENKVYRAVAHVEPWRVVSNRRAVGGFPAVCEFLDEIAGPGQKQARHQSMYESHESGPETGCAISECYSLMLEITFVYRSQVCSARTDYLLFDLFDSMNIIVIGLHGQFWFPGRNACSYQPGYDFHGPGHRRFSQPAVGSSRLSPESDKAPSGSWTGSLFPDSTAPEAMSGCGSRPIPLRKGTTLEPMLFASAVL